MKHTKRFYCPICGARLRLIKTTRIPKHVNINRRAGYWLRYPICEASGQHIREPQEHNDDAPSDYEILMGSWERDADAQAALARAKQE